MLTRWMPRAMRIAPQLDLARKPSPVRRRYALLINPFYPKDPHASFGKHVLTPSLALTTVAAATPETWTVSYWDENLLQGAPPCDPLPEVVGITVHLTFANRAFELARWYRDQGAKVVLGGLHVISCPDECAQHADALAIGDGVRLSVEQLAQGYEQCYRRIFSHASIWKRRPSGWRSVPPYLAMSYLYKRSNLLWHLLIRHRLTSLVWRPLVEITRRQHLVFRQRLMDQDDQQARGPAIVSAGV